MLSGKKDQVVHVRVSSKDKAAIERAATKAGMSTSEFMRACTLTMMVAELDSHALKVLVAGMTDAAVELVSSFKSKRVALG